MTQWQFSTISKLVESGAPALANELLNALNEFVNDYNKTIEENSKMKQQLESFEKPQKKTAPKKTEEIAE